jgi:hypothetical protein
MREPSKTKVQGGSTYYVHDGYGCESGCCGHRIYICNKDGGVEWTEFDFMHNKETLDEWVKELAFKLEISIGPCEFVDD